MDTNWNDEGRLTNVELRNSIDLVVETHGRVVFNFRDF